MDRAGREIALDKLRMVVDDYPVNLRQYNKDLAYLLAAYRDANLAERTASPPPFFDIEPTIDEDVVVSLRNSLSRLPRVGRHPKEGAGRVCAGGEDLRSTPDALPNARPRRR